MVMKGKTRGADASMAKAALAKRKVKNDMKGKAAQREAETRKKGGYGKAVVSIWDAPKGGIENSPAYRKLLTRCELDKNGKPPPPEKRDGAPLKGGFPVNKYPPNVIVDGQRAFWLPDEYAQVMKNTGPGGVYHGWMNPKGTFIYHRHGYPQALESELGRKCSVMEGLNALKRTLRRTVMPDADKVFHRDCLSAAEKKCIAPASEFHFGVVSARRANNESGQFDIMVVEYHFKQVGIQPTWYVDADSLADYKKLGLNAKVGGKLTPARNMILDDAKAKKKVAVEVSDDIGKWVYYDCEKLDLRGEVDFKKANNALLGTKQHSVSPLAAAQWILAKMRASPDKPKLGGVYPTSNASMVLGSQEFGKHHFILGDFFVAEPSSACRFDLNMTLKEDYDYTCSHIKEHGSVMRCQRMFLQVKHATNEGGAVAARDSAGEKEKANIQILQTKWPGVFRANGKRKGVAGTEVVMNWNGYGKPTEKSQSACPKNSQAACPITKVHKLGLKKVQKVGAKIVAKRVTGKYSPDAVLHYTQKAALSEYINARCKKLHLKKVAVVIGMKYKGTEGVERSYTEGDLAYDVQAGRVEVKKGGK